MKTNIEYRESRYATIEEMKSGTAVNDWKKKEFTGSGFPVYSDLENGQTSVASNDIHTLIIGGTGSKKTLCGVLPSILSMLENGESVVITDSKKDVYRHLYSYLKEKNIEVNVLDFRDPGCGNCWNPLHVAYQNYALGKRDKAIELVKDVARSLFADLSENTNDSFWTNMAMEYFVGLTLILFDEADENQITLEGIANLNADGQEKFGGTTFLGDYINSIKKEKPLVYRCLCGTVFAPNETRGSILSVFNQPVSELTCQENLNAMMANTDFNICKMGEKQTVTFLIMPDEKTTYNSLVTMFLKQSYEMLIALAEEKYEGVLPVRVNWVLEEAGNIPALPDFANMMTASRSRNIRFFLVFQSQQQIEQKYKGASDIIIGNCDCIVYFNSKDMKLLDYISKLAGPYRSKYGHETRPLISVNQLQHLSKENAECIIFLERQYPFRTRLPIIYDYEKYVAIQKKDMKLPPRQKQEKTYFDFAELVKARKKKKLLEMMNHESEETTVRETEIMSKRENFRRQLAERLEERRNERTNSSNE